MIEINLLPRELQKRGYGFKLEKNILYVLVAGVAISAAMFAFSYVVQASRLAKLEKQVREARAETTKYGPEIRTIEEISQKKSEILARMSVIQVLDKNREYWVRLMEDVARRVPDFVWLTSVRQGSQGSSQVTPGQPQGEPTQSSIEGFSFSLNALATFIIRLRKSDMIRDVAITSIKLQEVEKTKAYSFKLSCNLVMPPAGMPGAEMAKASGAMATQF